MEDFKIDPEKYAGLTREEAERRMEEDRIRAGSLLEEPRALSADAYRRSLAQFAAELRLRFRRRAKVLQRDAGRRQPSQPCSQ